MLCLVQMHNLNKSLLDATKEARKNFKEKKKSHYLIFNDQVKDYLLLLSFVLIAF